VRFVPSDEAARQRARDDHATSLVLVAGAGTGKTTLLIDRIESLVRSGRSSLLEIAAVTFTENAAATMKLRLRERLERTRATEVLSEVERTRAAAAIEVLERAQVSTLHALCTTMLQERPLECGVAPGFRIADESETDAIFAASWDEWLAERLGAGDADLAEAIRADIPLESAFEFGEKRSLRGLARSLLEQRDLDPIVSEAAPDPAAWRREIEERCVRGLALASEVKAADTLAPKLLSLAEFAAGARGLEGDDLARYLARIPKIAGRTGQKPKWPSEESLEEARRIAFWTTEVSAAWTAALGSRLHARLVRSLLGVIHLYEAKKRVLGVLDFLDLLLEARNALRDSAAVRNYFAGRFRYLIIDEFQDTDPLQVEIAQLLSQGVPGALVVVGDAKQSIYRFRRAEVSLLRRLTEEASDRPGHAVLHLTQNFRSRAAILRFVNRAFAALIQASTESDQPAYEAILPPENLTDEPSVLQLRFDAPPFAEARNDLLSSEASALAAFATRAADGGFLVRDPSDGRSRRSRAGDIMVLAPRLTQIRPLEEALEGAGVRFTVEGGKSFFGRQEVHEVLAVLRAIDDRSDRVSLVGALRSSFFGVRDSDIVAHVLSGGRLLLTEEVSKDGASPPLMQALTCLQGLHRDRLRLSVPALVERLYDLTGVLTALSATRRGESQVANLEKVVTLARQASALGALTLRGFTRLLEERATGLSEEPDLPTTRPGDPGTVRILSIHKAKGLEAPIVALYDQTANVQTRADVISLWGEGKVAVGFVEGCRPPGWNGLQERDRARAWAEGRRLLYVACTRARDLLVIPRPPSDARAGTFWRDLWPFLDASPPSDVVTIEASSLPATPHAEEHLDMPRVAGAEGGDAVAARWSATRRDIIARASERPFVPISATRFAARTAPPPVPVASARGRDFGGLVHQVLEWIPLDGPEQAPAIAAALAPPFGLDAAAARHAGEQVARALGTPVMERARRATRVWRELPLWFPEGSELVEGIVDLVFEESGRLVVVDYKTDGIDDGQAIPQAAHHAPQLQLYGRGLTQATGLPVAERFVLFTAIGRAVQV